MFFACPWASTLMVPLNIRLAVPEMVYCLKDCECEAILVDDAFAPVCSALRSACPDLRLFIFMGNGVTPEGCVNYETIISENEPAEDKCGVADDAYGLFYTGGTTGFSKGVVLSHTNILANAMGFNSYVQYSNKSVYLHAAPCFHLADGTSTFAATMNGATHVFVPKFDVVGVLSAIQTHKVTHVVLVPTMIGALFGGSVNLNDYDTTSLTHLLYGASAMPEVLLEKAIKQFGPILIQGYGMTELSPIVSVLTKEEHILGSEQVKSVGRPIFSVLVKIVDDNGKEVPVGTVGEVWVSGATVMKGYWNQPELNKKVLEGGWMHTGDGGCFDTLGFLYIKDRLKDMIKTGGENVYSAEVEQAVLKHPAVQECAVIGVPDEQLVERVCAIVVLKNGATATEAEIIKHCHTLIGGFKCPRQVVIRSESLPLSGAGKILKAKLREPFWANQSRSIYTKDDNASTAY
eukprot:TRINITY_DN5119_c0_g1_i1.p1 TRINITY_DN5119_c0_g1~~TRINITY_DN5119_c0_g1_i1.p1  ORF type:complete len:461 (-),score=108.78 TRINITY_DN5119_c0_g1_i1:28-1410(-)